MINSPYNVRLLTYKDTKEREIWRDLCNKFNNIDIFYYPDYSYLFELNGDGLSNCFVYYASPNDIVIYPFLIRPIKEIAHLRYIDKELYDITSPYGYSGYLANSPNINMDVFYFNFCEYCRNNNIITEFIRFNPLLNNISYCPKNISVRNLRQIVIINLLEDKDIIWSNINPKCRNKILKAKKKGVVIDFDNNFNEYSTFIELYLKTMERLKATDYYYFSDHFFNNLIKLMKNEIALVHARHNDKIINSALFIFKNEIIHYFLSGSLEEARNFAGNNLLLYEVAIWAKDRGFKYLNLGGGYASNDSLFHFKASFSKDYRDYYIGNNVFDYEAYRYLCMRSNSADLLSDINFFPLYRYQV